jgi:hypothetical protein
VTIEKRDEAGDGERHRDRERKALEAVPVPGQLLPVEEHHEVGERAAVDAFARDGPHQVHPHPVAAEREEQPVPEAQDPGVAPDQIHRQGGDPETEELAEKRHQVIGQAEDRQERHHQRRRADDRPGAGRVHLTKAGQQLQPLKLLKPPPAP